MRTLKHADISPTWHIQWTNKKIPHICSCGELNFGDKQQILKLMPADKAFSVPLTYSRSTTTRTLQLIHLPLTVASWVDFSRQRIESIQVGSTQRSHLAEGLCTTVYENDPTKIRTQAVWFECERWSNYNKNSRQASNFPPTFFSLFTSNNSIYLNFILRFSANILLLPRRQQFGQKLYTVAIHNICSSKNSNQTTSNYHQLKWNCQNFWILETQIWRS